MEDAIKQRVKEVLNQKNTNVTAISKILGLKQNTLSRQINGNTTMSADTLLSIIGLYPDVNFDWLLTGKGEMLRSANPLSNSATVHGDVSGSVVGNGVLHNGNVNGDGNIVGIVPADVERQLVRAKAEIDVLKKRIKEIETHHKKEKEVLNKMLDQAILDKERAMSMLEKALNK